VEDIDHLIHHGVEDIDHLIHHGVEDTDHLMHHGVEDTDHLIHHQYLVIWSTVLVRMEGVGGMWTAAREREL